MTEYDSDHGEKRMKFAVLMLLLMTPLPAAVAWAVGNAALPLMLLSLGFAGAGLLAHRVRSGLARGVLAAGLVGQSALLTAALAGHPWQIDTHMMFFAVLAVVSTMGSIRVLIMACGLTAVHHLGLTLALPAMVYPSADLLSNVMRTAIHGTIVVIEGGILSLSMLDANRRRAAMIEQRSEALRLTEEADTARKAAQRAGQRRRILSVFCAIG